MPWTAQPIKVLKPAQDFFSQDLMSTLPTFFFSSNLFIKKKKNKIPSHITNPLFAVAEKPGLPALFHTDAMSVVMYLQRFPGVAPSPRSFQHSCAKHPTQSVYLLAHSRSNQWVLATPQLNEDVTSKGLSLTINLNWCFCLEAFRDGRTTQALHRSKWTLNWKKRKKVQCPSRHPRTAFTDWNLSAANRSIQAATFPVQSITKVNCIYTKLQEF